MSWHLNLVDFLVYLYSLLKKLYIHLSTPALSRGSVVDGRHLKVDRADLHYLELAAKLGSSGASDPRTLNLSSLSKPTFIQQEQKGRPPSPFLSIS